MSDSRLAVCSCTQNGRLDYPNRLARQFSLLKGFIHFMETNLMSDCDIRSPGRHTKFISKCALEISTGLLLPCRYQATLHASNAACKLDNLLHSQLYLHLQNAFKYWEACVNCQTKIVLLRHHTVTLPGAYNQPPLAVPKPFVTTAC